MDPTVVVDVVPALEVVELSVTEYVEPMVETAPIFQQLPEPEVTTTDKGKGTFIPI